MPAVHSTDLNLSAAETAFRRNFETLGECGASVSVWQDGEEVLSLAAGYRDRQQTESWTVRTPVLVWSATKGPAAACLLHAMDAGYVSLETPVRDLWPGFGRLGKEGVTILEVLSHQAGLAGLDLVANVTNHSAVIEALERQKPLWPPGSGHGYHPRTFGFLVDEILRRVTGGTTLAEYWQQEFAGPLGLDFWIGVPEELVRHVAPVFPARTTSEPRNREFYDALTDRSSLAFRAFSAPSGLHSVSAMNTPESRALSLPAFGGIGTASALGKFYAMLAEGGALGGRRYFEPHTLEAMSTRAVDGPDLVLQVRTAFSAGFMMDPLDETGAKIRSIFGPSAMAFGHPGAGGSLAFADPEHRVAFAYVMNQMEPGVLANDKSIGIVEALHG